jgi:serine/threonine protein kinase/tetratricopeptide (TPR) repeat protein
MVRFTRTKNRGSSVGEADSQVHEAFGRYRLLERLGQGGMAEVFKAKSFGVEGFEKILVIKRILPELARSPEFAEMFIHEAKLAVRLSHANIVQVFDLGLAPASEGLGTKQPAAYYMAMEFVNGLDLATLLSRSRRQQVPLPIDLCVYVAAEVAKGLDHAHRRRDDQMRPLGIVHRDVSPQNVLLSLEGEVKVTDFGIAKAKGAIDTGAREETQRRQLQGKFAYMSPEQARGDAVDARSDLFSLGIVLYECLAGVNPFSAPTTFETMRRVQACEYPPIELLRSETPPDLVLLLKQALAKDPDARFADAGRMYEALLAFLYAHGRRYSGHDLAEFLTGFRGIEDTATTAHIADPMLDGDGSTAMPTPAESPLARIGQRSNRSESGIKSVQVPLERAAGVGERRDVTVLVVELPTREIPALGDKAAALILRYGGRILKREPEQITAVFGLGEPDGRDTELATRCALVALRALDGPRQPSAGVHTGRIHISAQGEATDDDRLESLVTTARGLARAREGRVAISSVALRQVKRLFGVEPIEGSTSATAASLVLDVRGSHETFGRFVGRKDELRTVGEVLAAATKRKARMLTIRGDHGVGKTRLLVEVARRLRKGNYNVGWHVATCPPRGREFPLSGIVAMLQVLCGIVEGDSPERVMTVEPRLRALGLHDEEVASILTALGGNVPNFTGNAKSVMRLAFARTVASLCEDRPHTFAWDAAHCMDEDSFVILEDAWKRLPNVRAVFVFAARAGFSHPLEGLGSHTSLELQDLRPEDSERLIAVHLGVEKAPEELVRFVRDRAGGHPQFIEEMLKALLDAHAVTVADGKVGTMKLVGQDLALPKTLRGLVASRVARLDASERATLQAAAVLGDPIDVAVLAQMLDQPMGALETSLSELKVREFLADTGPSALRFTSPIVREVVVDALPHDAARELHAAAGHALELVAGPVASEQSARIANHLYEAGDRERAAVYFAKSGERRLESRQLEGAAQDLARAIELVDATQHDPAELALWLSQLASAVRLVRSAPEAVEMCEAVIARVDQAGDVSLRVKTRVDASVILTALQKFEISRQHLAAAEPIAKDHPKLMKLVLSADAGQAIRQGDFKRSLELLDRLQGIVTQAGDKTEEHLILVHRAQAHAGLSDRKRALLELERAEVLLPNDAMAACERQKVRSLTEYFARDFRSAAVAAERAVDHARGLGLSYEVAVNLHNLGEFLIRLADFPRAYGAIRQSVALCDEFGFDRLASQNRMFLAFLDGVAGDATAEGTLRQGILYAEANDFTWDNINGRLLLAWLFQRRGASAAARVELDALLVLARATGNHLVVDDCELALRDINGRESVPASATSASR